MRRWQSHISGLAVLLLGLLVALIPVSLFPVCEAAHLGWVIDYQPSMRCFWYGQTEIILGLCVGVAGLALILRSTPDCRFAVGVALLALGVGIILVSCNGVIGSVCGHVNSRCQIGTKPASRWAGTLVCLTGGALLLWSLREPRSS